MKHHLRVKLNEAITTHTSPLSAWVAPMTVHKAQVNLLKELVRIIDEETSSS